MKKNVLKLFLVVSVIFTSSVIHAQYKIKGPGISPSKDTVYAGIPYEYRVVNFPNNAFINVAVFMGGI